MALKGKFVFPKWIETGQEEIEVQIPEDLSPEHSDYDRRGEIQIKTNAVGHYEDDPDQTYEDHILAINSCGIHSERYGDQKLWHVAIIWAIYPTEEDRRLAQNIVKGGQMSRYEPLDFDEINAAGSVYEFCYNYLKSEEWIKETTDI